MLESLKTLPADPILGLSVLFKADENPDKTDLGVGVYKDDAGQTVILSAIQKAFDHLAASEGSKVYVSPTGFPGFTESVQSLVFGDALLDALGGHIGTVQTPGGCGALRLAFDLIAQSNADAKVWVSNPTWANHVPILTAAGLTHKTYDYYNSATSSVDMDGMIESLKGAKAGDIVLLHGCCHNPSGADIPADRFDDLIGFIKEHGLIPFVDMAYQGFAVGLEEDAKLTRDVFAACPEAILSYSCSKNFGLYRERAGAVCVKGPNGDSGAAVITHLNKIARESYSMPPAHGAALAATVLASGDLTAEWKAELTMMRQRVQGLRASFDDQLKAAGIGTNVANVGGQTGMFSLLNLGAEKVQLLQTQKSIYMPGNGRINVAGLTEAKIPYVVSSIKSVL